MTDSPSSDAVKGLCQMSDALQVMRRGEGLDGAKDRAELRITCRGLAMRRAIRAADLWLEGAKMWSEAEKEVGSG